MTDHFKYPSIGQFRNAVKSVQHRSTYAGDDEHGDPIYDERQSSPVLEFIGTCKAHGSNAAIVFQYDDNCVLEQSYCQSRSRVITPTNDNLGFARFVEDNKVVESIDAKILELGLFTGSVTVYGEWCGGSIQKGVAINKTDRMFIIFSVKHNDTWLIEESCNFICDRDIGVYSVYDFNSYKIEVDFNYPERSVEALTEITNAVEEECPIGKHFGVSGVGEGVVWKCVTGGWEDPKFWFKVKGAKHQSSKVKTLAPVDVERIDNIRSLIENFVTDSRCRQMMDGMDFDRQNIGPFIKAMFADIVKEETDTIEESGFKVKDVSGEVSKQAKVWFFEQELV